MSDWVLHVRGNEVWEDVVEMIHEYEPSLVVVPACSTPQETAIGARHMKQMIEDADVGYIQIVVPIVGATRVEQREFFKWADGIGSYLPAPTEASLNNIVVDLLPLGHYAVLAPESFVSNNFVGTWEIIINDPTRAV